MDNLQVILSLVVTLLGFLTSTITFVIKYINSLSAKCAAEDQVALGGILLSLIAEAEQFLDLSGEEKKDYVIAKAQKYALEHSLVFDAASLATQIDALVALTKRVNIK